MPRDSIPRATRDPSRPACRACGSSASRADDRFGPCRNFLSETMLTVTSGKGLDALAACPTPAARPAPSKCSGACRYGLRNRAARSTCPRSAGRPAGAAREAARTAFASRAPRGPMRAPYDEVVVEDGATGILGRPARAPGAPRVVGAEDGGRYASRSPRSSPPSSLPARRARAVRAADDGGSSGGGRGGGGVGPGDGDAGGAGLGRRCCSPSWRCSRSRSSTSARAAASRSAASVALARAAAAAGSARAADRTGRRRRRRASCR